MKNKKTSLYIITIVGLAVILSILWFLIISENNAISNNNNGQGMHNNLNVTYKANKEITEDTKITSGKYNSEIADENAILTIGDINVTLSGINVNKI